MILHFGGCGALQTKEISLNGGFSWLLDYAEDAFAADSAANVAQPDIEKLDAVLPACPGASIFVWSFPSFKDDAPLRSWLRAGRKKCRRFETRAAGKIWSSAAAPAWDALIGRFAEDESKSGKVLLYLWGLGDILTACPAEVGSRTRADLHWYMEATASRIDKLNYPRKAPQERLGTPPFVSALERDLLVYLKFWSLSCQRAAFVGEIFEQRDLLVNILDKANNLLNSRTLRKALEQSPPGVHSQHILTGVYSVLSDIMGAFIGKSFR